MAVMLKFLLGTTFTYFICLIYTEAQGILAQALYLGTPDMFNGTRDDCVWKRGNDREECPDPDINFILYTSRNGIENPDYLDITQGDWLRNSDWQPDKENVLLIHGYAGGDNIPPMNMLRDAYLKHGNYNVFVADWGVLGQPPCYIAAVHNIRPVSRCLAMGFDFLRNSGMRSEMTTCIGHSLGAHICGLMANYLQFRIERIIALDPARPLIKPGAGNRLDTGDAKSVQVLHTNAGYYGEGGQVGHVDFCINGGRRQPYCSTDNNTNLCSHLWSVCYLAQSIFPETQIHAEPCSRRCPPGPLRPADRRAARRSPMAIQHYIGNAIPMGQFTPKSAHGSYCLKDNQLPYCPTAANNFFGDERCCL